MGAIPTVSTNPSTVVHYTASLDNFVGRGFLFDTAKHLALACPLYAKDVPTLRERFLVVKLDKHDSVWYTLVI